MSSQATKNNRNGKKKKQQRGRIRGRQEVGVGGALNAVQNYDYDQQMASALARYAVARSSSSSFPSFEELQTHWKVQPADSSSDGKEQLLCNLDGGKWVSE